MHGQTLQAVALFKSIVINIMYSRNSITLSTITINNGSLLPLSLCVTPFVFLSLPVSELHPSGCELIVLDIISVGTVLVLLSHTIIGMNRVTQTRQVVQNERA